MDVKEELLTSLKEINEECEATFDKMGEKMVKLEEAIKLLKNVIIKT